MGVRSKSSPCKPVGGSSVTTHIFKRYMAADTIISAKSCTRRIMTILPLISTDVRNLSYRLHPYYTSLTTALNFYHGGRAPQRPKGRKSTISALNAIIGALNLAKEVSSITVVFGSIRIIFAIMNDQSEFQAYGFLLNERRPKCT